MTIIIYWFLLGMGLNFLLQDTLVVAESSNANQSYSLMNTSTINMTTTGGTPEKPSLKSFINTLKMMFAFSTPEVAGLPSAVTFVISFVNWFLMVFFGIAVYRVANPLSGD